MAHAAICAAHEVEELTWRIILAGARVLQLHPDNPSIHPKLQLPSRGEASAMPGLQRLPCFTEQHLFKVCPSDNACCLHLL